MGGVYFLLKLRDTKPSEHASKIKLRNIIVYAALVTARHQKSYKPTCSLHCSSLFWLTNSMVRILQYDF